MEQQTETSVGARRRPPAVPRRRLRRRILPLVALLLAGFLLVGVFAAIGAFGVRRDMEQGRELMNRARRALLQGDAEEAGRAFGDARERFASARSRADGIAFRVLGWLPVAGRTPDALAGMASAGTDLAEAGRLLAEPVSRLPGGLSALAPSRGRVPVARLLTLGDELARSEAKARAGLETIRATSTTLLFPPVGDARREAEEQASEAHRVLAAAHRMLQGLPAFLGAEEPAEYFFVAQNPAEIRGTGGIMGAYSILRIEGGRFDFSPFRPVQDLPTFRPDDVPAPSEDYRRNYDRYGGAGFLLNINMTPDFPSAAEAILANYERATGTSVDGVIAADPHALRALLEVTGPTEIPRSGVEVNADDVVALTANEAYARFLTPAQRKRVLGDVAEAVFARFLEVRGEGIRKLRALGHAAAGGHIRVFARDAVMQEGLVLTGVAGAFTTPDDGKDFVSVIANNAAGNKVDFYEDRRIEHTVRLEQNGEGRATTVVKTTNGAPTSGHPRRVLGPHRSLPDAVAGENITILHVYCAGRCTVDGAARDGEALEPVIGSELGHPYLRDAFRVRSGESSALTVDGRASGVWEGNSSGGRYSLTFVGQSTIRPTTGRIEVTAPDGMSITHTSVPMEVTGPTAVWEGTVEDRMDLVVEFRPSLPLRMWRNVTRFLGQPVVRL